MVGVIYIACFGFKFQPFSSNYIACFGFNFEPFSIAFFWLPVLFALSSLLGFAVAFYIACFGFNFEPFSIAFFWLPVLFALSSLLGFSGLLMDFVWLFRGFYHSQGSCRVLAMTKVGTMHGWMDMTKQENSHKYKSTRVQVPPFRPFSCLSHGRPCQERLGEAHGPE